MPTMPHMLFPLRRFLPCTEFRGPTRNLALLRAFDGERAGRDVFGDDGTRAGVGALAHFHRRNQRGVRADERAIADLGAMLVEAVIVAGDGTRTDIGAVADRRIAEISEMIGLRAFADFG